MKTAKNENSKVYEVSDIRRMLNLSHQSSYRFINEVYANKSPFPVIKIGGIYRIPKEPFDEWLNNGCC